MDIVNYALSNKIKKYVDKSVGNISDEKIANAINSYFEENPVASGATPEQVEQIQKNTDDIDGLKGDLVSLENLLRQIQDKLNQGTVVDNITVNEINNMIVSYFENKIVSEVEA